ncbi:MAG: tRNA uridine-5-carboxymethylaminomethyl(34) synthesis GTPase MnmE [Chthonomonadales bacterium]
MASSSQADKPPTPMHSTLLSNDTITAIATPPGSGGVSIVRIVGSNAIAVADRMFTSRQGAIRDFPTHTIHYGLIVDPENNEQIDDVVTLIYLNPASYTGEDTIEFCCHGGPITSGRILNLALANGARMAEPGEFTKRAFLNGKIDLAQAEAVCDLISSQTESAARLAVQQRAGQLSRRIQELRSEIVSAIAAVEVTIDFSDEVGDLDYDALKSRLSTLISNLEALLKTADQGILYRDGIRLVIIGRPNVGKSSLMNALLRQDRAIVTAVPGTTRDTIEERANIGGIPIVAVDTAGIRETDDEVERIGIERSHAAIHEANLLLVVLDISSPLLEAKSMIEDLPADVKRVFVLNKSDLVDAKQIKPIYRDLKHVVGVDPVVAVSTLTGSGLPELENAIQRILQGSQFDIHDTHITNVRHKNAVEQALASVKLATETTENRMPPDFISIDLRSAADALGEITGETASDEVIHRIFHDFCVGK